MSKRIKSICVISQGYPTDNHPYFTFVEELCVAFSKQGLDVYVIAPQSITSCLFRGSPVHPTKRFYTPKAGKLIRIYQPWMITVPFRFLKFNDILFTLAVNKMFRKLKICPDVIYAHFWNNGLYVSKSAKDYNIPMFVASGEGNFDNIQEVYSQKKYIDFSAYVKGVICVSSHTRDWSCKLKLTTIDKCKVIPNSINTSKFHLKDKIALRKKYGFSKEDFIVAFVGSFINRKGSNRLSNAIERLNDKNIKSFFIGSPQGRENLLPTCDGVLFCGKVNHEELPNYLNMADVFVLPTLNEGCCNAIIEAMACGLPIISSNLSFNWDVLDETNSILIDPNNIDEIANAIKVLKNDDAYRRKLSEGAIEKAKSLSINNRAATIIDFIESKF